MTLGLLADARRAGGFGDDEAVLRSRAEELAKRFADAAIPGRPEIELKLRHDGQTELSVGYSDGVRAEAMLRGDGFVASSSTRWQGHSGPIDLEDMEPWEKDEEDRRRLAYEAARGKPKFRGKKYQRTVVAPPQPGAAERILVAELYTDGLIVEFTYDTGMPRAEAIEKMRDSPRPPMRIGDDLGTDYYENGRASYGGSPNSRAHFGFAPAPPPDARVLRITTDSGTVELDLQL
ncbi:MAG TPA: hypothetical protein VJL81_12385 [Solirubrobacterales bacterium]|nr:hypothetical protein [Solirubrobacterales bacterium]